MKPYKQEQATPHEAVDHRFNKVIAWSVYNVDLVHNAMERAELARGSTPVDTLAGPRIHKILSEDTASKITGEAIQETRDDEQRIQDIRLQIDNQAIKVEDHDIIATT